MRVSLKSSEVDELFCNICMVPAFSPVYHCRCNHVTCGTCYGDFYDRGVLDKCQICHKGEDNIVSECKALTSLVNRMEFECPNIEEGCPFYFTIDQQDEHISLCEHARFSCPVCERGFEEKILLMDHFFDHEPLQLTYGESLRAIINPGGYLFYEKTHGDYYFLLFSGGTISLQHMEWGKKTGYEVYVVYLDDACDMAFSGQTEVVKRWPEPSQLSLRLPVMFSNRRTKMKLTIRDNEL